MSVSVRIPGPLRRLTAGESQVKIEGATAGEVLAGLETRFPGFQERLFEPTGELRPFINIYVNDTDIRFEGGLDTAVNDRDEVTIIPAVAGG
jgi:molybdopterin synthase sulfur carrier subunit